MSPGDIHPFDLCFSFGVLKFHPITAPILAMDGALELFVIHRFMMGSMDSHETSRSPTILSHLIFISTDCFVNTVLCS